MALVSVAFVVLVHKDAHDHAIWTVVVVSHPVVTDHHPRHSLELVSVEAPVIETVVVIAHAIHFQLLLFLSHQVEELEATLVVVQADLAVQEVQEAPEVCQEDQQEHQYHQRRSKLTSRVFLPEHNHCPLTRAKCGAEESRIGLQDKPSRRLVLNVFFFWRSTQAVDSPLAAKMSKIVTDGALK